MQKKSIFNGIILCVITIGVWVIVLQNFGLFDEAATQNVRVVNTVDANVNNTIDANIVNEIEAFVTNTIDAEIGNSVHVYGEVDIVSSDIIDVNIEEVGGYSCYRKVPVSIER